MNNLTPLLFVVFETSLGISIGRISLLITVNFGVQMLVDLLSAKWINVIGTRRAIVAAHAFAAAGLVALGVLPYRTADPYVGVLCAVCLCAVGGGITEVLISPIVEALPSEDKAGSMSLLHAFYCWGHVGVVVLSTLYFALAGTGRWALLPVLWAVLPLCNMVLFARVPLCTLAGDVGCALGPGVVGAVSGMAGGALKAGLLAACAFPVLLLLAVSRLRRRPKGEQ